VRSALRSRPNRIPIGEGHGAEALDLLKAWGKGHPGSIGTIHAGAAFGALRRMEQLMQEAVVTAGQTRHDDGESIVGVASEAFWMR